MDLKKLVLGIVLVAFVSIQSVCLAQNVSDATLKSMIAKYKSKNYTGCLQATEKILKTNPSNIYAHYYQGLSYMQLGKKDEAIKSFENAKSLNSNKTIVGYAERGIACLSNPEECEKFAENENDLETFINSKKFYDNSVQAEINKKKLERIKDNINDELGTNKKSEMPSNDEIAQAVKTLAKVGLNPLNGMNNNAMYSNPEYMQMNMLLGNNGSYNNMNMLPFLLMSQNPKDSANNGMSPELIQTMMMSQMPMY